jgi:hypothetical protein
MSTLPSELTPVTDQPEAAGPDQNKTELYDAVRKRVQLCKQHRRKLSSAWQTNVDYRRGKLFSSESDDHRVVVPVDWYLTKQKQAALFSAMPKVHISRHPQSVSAETDGWLFKYDQKLNDTLKTAFVEFAMEELLPDCINAAGFGAAIVSHEAITEEVEVPAIDLGMLPPDIQQFVLQSGVLPNGEPIPMVKVPRIKAHRYLTNRISPIDFIWDTSFVGSNFDQSPLIGRTGRVTWPDAQRRWNLKPEDKKKYVGSSINNADRLTEDFDGIRSQNDGDLVQFDEIYFYEHFFNPQATNYDQIHHMIFLGDSKEPILDEPWSGQILTEDNQIIGSLKYPIRVLTLTYLTDEAIPISDSAAARPQTKELNESRTQMILQRKYSLPTRWYDVNRIDPTVLETLLRGAWQAAIPVQGSGQAAMGDLTRASMPPENFTFDRITKEDLQRIWNIGQDTAGAGVETSGEAREIAATASGTLTHERGRVARFFCGIAEVLGGLIAIHEDSSYFGQGFDPAVSRTLQYSIVPDSTVLQSASQQRSSALELLNLGLKTGWLKPEPLMRQIVQLSGLDPSALVGPPPPSSPTEPNISLRLTGSEDLLNPLALATLVKSGQAPNSEDINTAKRLLEEAAVQQNPVPDGPPSFGPGPGLPVPTPDPMPPGPGDAYPDATALDRINKRTVDR